MSAEFTAELGKGEKRALVKFLGRMETVNGRQKEKMKQGL